MLVLLDPLREFTLMTVFLRLFLAALFGACIGLERGMRHHAAGFRTYSIVCIGAASVMLLSQYLLLAFGSGDPSRMGAQVISGIGFLGAGTILITGHSRGQRVKGLTTAAGLWSAACMGLAIGAGFYEAAVMILLLLLVLIAGLTHLDEAHIKTAAAMQVYIEYDSSDLPFSDLLLIIRSAGWHMSTIEFLANDPSRPYMVLLDLRRDGPGITKSALLQQLHAVEGVLCAEDL